MFLYHLQKISLNNQLTSCLGTTGKNIRLLVNERLFFIENEDKEHWKLVKAADKISAYIKCLEELKAGIRSFLRLKILF
ncbi:MAG: hypothetical protein KGZ94_04130 [Clostridia bacterium]|nr:hypothetical protein [Clostridia bacterium]